MRGGARQQRHRAQLGGVTARGLGGAARHDVAEEPRDEPDADHVQDESVQPHRREERGAAAAEDEEGAPRDRVDHDGERERVAEADAALAPRPGAHRCRRPHRRHDAEGARDGAAAAEPEPVGGGDRARDCSGQRALHEGDQRERNQARVDEASVAHLDARLRHQDGEQGEHHAVDQGSPARPARRLLRVEPAPGVGVEDQAQRDGACRLDDVVVVHGG